MFSHWCAAIAVRRALGRWRLHDDVGHFARVISALRDKLKDRKWALSAAFICLYVYMYKYHCYLIMSICISSYLCVSVNTLHTVYELLCMCSGGEYLAIFRQDHGLGVAELLLHIMQRCRVMALGIRIAERRRAQGVRGSGTLHALHRG